MSIGTQIEVETLLNDLARHCVRISLAPGDKLRLSAKGKPPVELLERLRAVKPQVVAVLRQQAPAQAAQWWESGAICWHCSGMARCHCITCDTGVLESQTGPCKICRGSGRLPETVQ
jgi:hypothetical protein